MSYVEDYYPIEPKSDNDNLTQLNILTREVISVQYHTLGSESLHLNNQINKYARDAIALLSALGVNRKKLKDLVDIEFDKSVLDIDDAYGKAATASISLASTLCVDVHKEVRTRLASIISEKKLFAIDVDITQ